MPTPAKPASPGRERSAPGQIRSVQALRAIAALFVVLFHSTVLWHDKFAPSVVPWENGNAGVDLFFVISGFIMVLSSRRLLGQPDGWSRFMVLRLVRIAPMYWLATAAKLAAVAAVPALALHTHPTAWNSVAAFLFVPARDAIGVIRPPLDVGWTLSFEMLFYLVFASALFLRVEPLRVVGPVMAALAVLSLARTIDGAAITTLASPIVLEFIFGMLIAQAFLGTSSPRVFSPWTIAMSAAGLLCLALVPTDGVWNRVAIWGLAAAATLAGSVVADRWLDRLMPRLFVRIGEASYSLYLTHGFVLPVVGLVLARTGLAGNVLGGMLIVSCLVVSTLAALVVYRFVEVPITAWLRLLVGGRRRASLVAPQTAI
jgi:exopolysaccharide production protein ExoZ